MTKPRRSYPSDAAVERAARQFRELVTDGAPPTRMVLHPDGRVELAREAPAPSSSPPSSSPSPTDDIRASIHGQAPPARRH